MKKHSLNLLLLLCAWPGAGAAQAPSPGTVGTVGGWGNNNYGQTSVPIAAQSGVTAIAAGGAHTVALKNDGSVVAWGNNDNGQPTVPVAAQSGVMAIAVGGSHTVALKNDGSVVAWGREHEGQTTVPVTAQSGVMAIAAGSDHTVALKNDGSVVAWGDNTVSQANVPAGLSGVTAIAAGSLHTVALKYDGTVVAWGHNYSGQVTGTPTTSFPHSATASPVTLEGQVLTGVTAIAAGGSHTVALKNDGSVLAWGDNTDGQANVPAGLSGVTAIAAGWSHTVALKNNGLVVAWGRNYEGQTTVPAGLSGVTAIAAGSLHTVVLVIPTAPTITTQPVSQTVNEWQGASLTVTATGFPVSYQWRKDGMDLAGATSATYTLTLARLNQAGSYTVVVSNPAGSVTSAPPAVLTVTPSAPGAVVAWGDNYHGQTTVPIAAQSGVIAIAAGGDSWGYQADGSGQTVALKNDGTVVAWGAAAPVPSGLSGVTAIAAGIVHTVALKSDGAVVAWGANSFGQTTVPLAAQSDVRAIAAGREHTVALKSDGTVVAWGGNWAGQVTGTPTTSLPYSATASPVTLGGQVLTGVTAIAVGFAHSIALKSDGTVVEWGYRSGVWSVGGVMAIAAGGYHTVALKNDGSVVGGPLAAQSRVTAIAAGGDNYTFHALALKNDGTVVAWGEGTNNTGGIAEYGQSIVPAGLSGVTAIAAGATHSVALLGTVQLLPFLTSRHSGNELILSWPTNAVGFTLQSTPNLTPPVTWVDVTNPPALLGTQWNVTNTFSGSAQFYRLRKP